MEILERLDGRIEIVCEHGVGHPSSLLQQREWMPCDGVHGCDGCCQTDEFVAIEQRFFNAR